MLRDSGSKTVDSKMGDNYTLASFGSRDPESGCCWELVSVKKLNAALRSAASDPSVSNALKKGGYTPILQTVDEANAFMDAQIEAFK